MSSLPPLYALRSFEAAARLDSFKKAAKELNLTPAAVAYQVKKLEHSLGVELFARNGRGVQLNRAGAEYMRIAQSLLFDFRRKTQLFKAQYEAHPIRIGALHFVSERLVLPLVQNFLTDFPDAKTELIADLQEPDFRGGNLDVMLWHGTDPSKDFTSICLLTEHLTPVCAPDLLLQFPDGINMTDLQDIPALYDLVWDEDWDYWLSHVGAPQLTNSMGFSLYSTLIQAVKSGQGVTIGHTGLLAPELLSGELVKPFSQEVPAPKQFYLLTTEENLRNANVKAFWDWVQTKHRNPLT